MIYASKLKKTSNKSKKTRVLFLKTKYITKTVRNRDF